MTRRKYSDKRAWVLARLQAKYEHSSRTHNPPQRPFICAMDEEDQKAWEAAFGGKVVYYTVGPKISPDFARTLRRMFVEGDLARVTGGNQDARYYCQKTYYISYTFRRWPPQ
jgi:hypothetical protein